MLIEDVTHNGPRQIVHGCGRRNITTAREDNRGVDIAKEATRPLLETKPDDNRSKEPENPEVLQIFVDTIAREDSGRSDETIDDGSGEKYLAVGAGEVSLSVSLADVGDVAHSPVEDTDLNEHGPERSNNLGPEHSAGRDLQVMPEFHILHKG